MLNTLMDWMLMWALLLLGFWLALVPSYKARFVGHVVLLHTVLYYTGIELQSYFMACAFTVSILCAFSMILKNS